MQATSRTGNRGRAHQITLLEAFQEFPDLLETASLLIFTWIEAQHELLARLWKDRVDVSSIFLRDAGRFRVVGIRPGLSDPHDVGRSATLIQFDGARRLIYKPRPCDGEQLWFDALAWLNRNGIRAPFRIPILLARKDYTWMEFLRTKSCRNRSMVRLFYFRWGVQAALAQILDAADLHRENWLAVGSQPILVDAELIGDEQHSSSLRGKKMLDRQSLPALLRTGLLPLTPRDGTGLYQGIAPFDATIAENGPTSCWPRCSGAIQKPANYVNDLSRGFAAAAGIFAIAELARKFFREIILQSGGEGKRRRVLLRASAQYARFLRASLEPHNMISIGERWRCLARACGASSISRRTGLAEARALLNCDIPKFTARRSTRRVSWNRFSAAIANLKNSSRLLRSRVRTRDSR